MTALKLFVVFVVLFFSQVMFGAACFDGSQNPSFLKLLDQTRLSDSSRLGAVSASCNEIAKPFEHFQQSENRLPLKDKAINRFLQFTGGGPEALMTTMSTTPAQRAYKTSLDNIKRNPDRMERIRLTYDLVVETMGPYEKSIVGNGIPDGYGPSNKEYNPANIVERAAQRGSGGICRHHATLLAWSLNYVAKAEGGSSAATDSFKAKTKDGCNKEYCHMWVGLEIPLSTSNGIRTEFIDLDSTNYPQFTFLNSKLNGITRNEQTRIGNICSEVKTCLEEQIKSRPQNSNSLKLERYNPSSGVR